MLQLLPINRLRKECPITIIGGGTSLRGFDWEVLRNQYTIGCNGNFLLGSDIVDVCIFGDFKFFDKYSSPLEKFEGLVVTNCEKLRHSQHEWLYWMPRKQRGLHADALGWNASTGASAINLALLLGATQIYLLGFDMKLNKKGENNWHSYGCDKPKSETMGRMLNGMSRVYIDWKKKFSHVPIINVNDDSDLDYWHKIRIDDYVNERKKNEDKNFFNDDAGDMHQPADGLQRRAASQS